jgi:hypothetical protein
MYCIQYAMHTIRTAHNTYGTQYALHTICTAHNTYCTQYVLHTIRTAHNTYCTQYVLHTIRTAHNMYCTQLQHNVKRLPQKAHKQVMFVKRRIMFIFILTYDMKQLSLVSNHFCTCSQSCEDRLLAWSCLSVHPHGTTWLPWDRFSLNLIFRVFIENISQKFAFH